jgi:hypothetical protein
MLLTDQSVLRKVALLVDNHARTGEFVITVFMLSRMRILSAVNSLRGMAFLENCHIVRHNSLAASSNLGRGHCCTISYLLLVGVLPSTVISWPMYSKRFMKNDHVSNCNETLYF